MTKFLNALVTDKTPILRLEPNPNISNEEKTKIIDVSSSILDNYIKNMYCKDGLWYYYKKDEDNYGYPFFIIDELMGTYLARIRNLKTVTYQVASVKDTYGLASMNFKKEGYKYFTIIDLIKDIIIFMGTENIEILKTFTINSNNAEEFMKHIYNFLALDIHMLQKDRAPVNFQFEENIKTGYFDLAPLYDYSNCSRKVGADGINIPNKMIKLDDLTIISLMRKIPEFKAAIELCLDLSMQMIWNQICIDYKFNQDCSSYERIREYYEIKDESMKQHVKKLIMSSK